MFNKSKKKIAADYEQGRPFMGNETLISKEFKVYNKILSDEHEESFINDLAHRLVNDNYTHSNKAIYDVLEHVLDTLHYEGYYTMDLRRKLRGAMKEYEAVKRIDEM